MSTIYRKPNQIIHPWQFGHRQKKETWIWLRGLPPLVPTAVVGPPPHRDDPAVVEWEDCWRMGPSVDRPKKRSETFPGIANAMAQQWG